MSRPDPRPSPIASGLRANGRTVEEHELGVEEDEYDGRTLWRLFGAATLAVLALATASLVLV